MKLRRNSLLLALVYIIYGSCRYQATKPEFSSLQMHAVSNRPKKHWITDTKLQTNAVNT